MAIVEAMASTAKTGRYSAAALSVDPLQAAVAAALPAAELLHEHRPAVSDQPGADMATALIGIRAFCRIRCKSEHPLGYFVFGLAGSASQLFDDSPIAVPRVEIHPGIDPRGVPSKHLLHAARVLEDLPPVEHGKLPEAGEGIADGDLVLCLAVLLAQVDLPQRPVVGALQPSLHQHQRCFLVVEVVHELAREIGTGTGLPDGKLGKDGKELVRAPPVGPDQPARPEISNLPFPQLGGSAQGEVPDALDQSDAEHLREGPQLGYRQGIGGLGGIDETTDVLPVQAQLQVSDELACNIIDARQTFGVSAGQARKPPAELYGEIHLDVARVALDDVFVVEDPFRRGRCSLLQPARLGEILTDLVDLPTGILEPREHCSLPAARGKRALRMKNKYGGRDVAALAQQENGGMQRLKGRLEDEDRFIRYQPPCVLLQQASLDAARRTSKDLSIRAFVHQGGAAEAPSPQLPEGIGSLLLFDKVRRENGGAGRTGWDCLQACEASLERGSHPGPGNVVNLVTHHHTQFNGPWTQQGRLDGTIFICYITQYMFRYLTEKEDGTWRKNKG